jgi:hypothetical protein
MLAGAAAGPAPTLLQTALDTYRREHHTLPARLSRSLDARPESSEKSGQRKLWWIHGG